VAELVAGIDGRQRLRTGWDVVAREDGDEVVMREVGRIETDQPRGRRAGRDEVRRGQGRRHQARIKRGRQFGKGIVEWQIVGGAGADNASSGRLVLGARILPHTRGFYGCKACAAHPGYIP
jgi:hypothetical protein